MQLVRLSAGIVAAFLSISDFALAAGVIGDCGANDAPLDFQGENCTPSGGVQDMCFDNGTEFVCDLERFTECAIDGNIVSAAADFGGTSTHDFSAWGTCDGVEWCCVLDDADDDVVTFIVNGTAFDEELMDLSPVNDGENMAAHRALDRLYGEIHGRGGDDRIEGSFTTASDYGDKLFGDGGEDRIDGFDDRDYINGGTGADVLNGGDGNDRIVGGGGFDQINGGNGLDTLCGEAKTSGVCDADLLDGGANDDILWVPFDGSCTGANRPTFTPGLGTDQDCGDNDWGNINVSGECDDLIAAEPATCAEPT